MVAASVVGMPSIPVFFVTTSAWVLWIVVPLLVEQVGRLQRRKQRPRQVT